MNLPQPRNPKLIIQAALVVGLVAALGFELGFSKMVAVLFLAALGGAAAYALQIPEVKKRIKDFLDNQ